MSKWKLFIKLKSKEKEIAEPQEIKENTTTDSQETSKEEESSQEEKQVLAEYKETLYTNSQAAIKRKKQALTDQRIWRDMDSIEKNIDDLEIKKVVKPVKELEKKVDNIISRGKESSGKDTITYKKPSNVIYVVSKPQPGQVKGDWAVRGHGKIYSHHRKKDSAIKQARKIAQEKNATVLIQNTDGTFSSGFKPKQKK
ncbi:MAG: DUF2188 domain-containing protein [Thermoplasmatales archaeon]|nr:MAG: DUF2188 domain-containing protein [Thermoplasmatales archaeon]